SRRRHTRFSRDWSSDVCSSDLGFRDERLLQMTQVAAQEALSHYRGEPVPLILAGPENYPGLLNQLPSNFLSLLKGQASLPILYKIGRASCREIEYCPRDAEAER